MWLSSDLTLFRNERATHFVDETPGLGWATVEKGNHESSRNWVELDVSKALEPVFEDTPLVLMSGT